MINFMKTYPVRQTAITIALIAVALSFAGCDIAFHRHEITPDTFYSDRKVTILYSAGKNSISGALREDIEELIRYTALHTNDERADALLIYTHSYANSSPLLLYPYRDLFGRTKIDTLVTYPKETISASSKTLNEVLNYIRDNFPADEYGMIFSSHATGYLPAGYYSNSKVYEQQGNSPRYRKTDICSHPESVPFKEKEHIPGTPMTRSIGQDRDGRNGYEMQIEDFAQAIPMKLKYIVFDCCLVSGIETAYQLRDKTEYIVASPAEVLADGMDYKSMVRFLQNRPYADLKGLCSNHFEHYNRLEGAYRSATIALTDCSALEELASVCRNLFEKYRNNLDSISPDDVQQYYSYDYHWFYDLLSIVEHLGCTSEEMDEFKAALDRCVIYKAATETFLASRPDNPYPGFVISTYCGLSMYLPAHQGAYGNNYLESYYRELAWNKATALVK